MLDVTNLECVRGHRRLFTDLNFSAGSGDFVQLIGPNGSGKTSLLRMLCGLLPPDGGRIRWRGTDIYALGEEYYSALTYVGHRAGVKDELTAYENLRVSCGLAGHEIGKGQAINALAHVGLRGREHLPARLLSEGQRRRLALARLSVCQTSLWLLDEVLTSLDRSAGDLVHSLTVEHLQKGGTVIVATHQELNWAVNNFQCVNLTSRTEDHASQSRG
jgi:heme exporter protein A